MLLGKSLQVLGKRGFDLVLQAPVGGSEFLQATQPEGSAQRDWKPGSLPQGQGRGFQGCFLGIFLSFSVRAVPSDHELLLCPRANPEISWVNLGSISRKLHEQCFRMVLSGKLDCLFYI